MKYHFDMRTEQQNKSLHKLYEMLADELNSAGLDMKKVLKPEIDIPWNGKTIKEYLWRPIQKVVTGKKSTAELDSNEIDQIFVVLSKHLGEKFGIEVVFPSIETLDKEANARNNN
jgi:hypothetical protein